MKVYCVQATVEYTDGRWRSVLSVPTFYLNSNVQGIVDCEHARVMAKEVINPTNNPDITVNAHVTEIE